MSKLNVGDKIFIVDTLHRKTKFYSLPILKVGRDYYTIERFSRTLKIRINDLIIKDNPSLTAYTSVDEYLNYTNHSRAVSAISYLNPSEIQDIPIDNLLKCADLLGLSIKFLSESELDINLS